MRWKFFSKNLIYLSLFFLFGSKVPVTYAWVPGGAHGTVYMRDFDNNEIPIPGVKINREDYWTFPYCGGGKCWGVNDTVETTSSSDGKYSMDNWNNDPGPVTNCETEHGANRCPSGRLGNIPSITQCPKPPAPESPCCWALNWCGFNCDSNPHRWKAYFPLGFTLPENYSTTIGHWEAPNSECGSKSGDWSLGAQTYYENSYYQHDFNNYQDRHDCDFIWVPEAMVTPTSTPTPTITPGGPTLTPTPTTTPPGPTLTPTPTPLSGATPTATWTPTPTGSPTITPTRTPTPSPTTTQTPTPTPTTPGGGGPPPTPTPTPEFRCSCYLLSAEGNPDLGEIKKGDTLRLIGEAYVAQGDAAESHEMAYWLYRWEDGHDIEPKIAYSGHISTGNPVRPVRTDNIPGVGLVDVYRTTWSYPVPPTAPTGTYHVKLEIFCREKLALNIRGFSVQSEEPTPTPTPRPPSFWDLIRRLFGTIISFVSPQGPTLKLGSFKPQEALPEGGCTDLYFRVVKE